MCIKGVNRNFHIPNRFGYQDFRILFTAFTGGISKSLFAVSVEYSLRVLIP